jgi:acyl-CoA synthetase (AMP-forming)/AMP-acid ligase II
MPPVPHFLLLQPESPDDQDHPVKWAFGLSPPDVWTAFQERFGLPLHGGYGSTETTMVGMSGFRTDPPYPKDQLDLPLGGSVMGLPIPGWCDIRIADENSNVVAPLAFGEVQIHGPGVLTEYYNNPEATRAAFTPDGWFKSGDIGYYAEDGRFVMVDRTKNLIRRSGENIAPAEVEEVLMDHPAIAEVAVVPVADELRGQELRACIVVAEGASVSAEDVYAYCEEELAGFKVPRYLEFCDELPHTPTFKVQKEQLVSSADPARWVDRVAMKKNGRA